MSTARKILLVDDDEDLRTSLQEQLSLHDEFEVSVAGTAGKGIEAAKAGRHDLVVFDVGLPDMDGREAVKLLRKSGYKSPIIMLTANDSDADQILGLDAGANDYVTKPFKFAVLLAFNARQFISWLQDVDDKYDRCLLPRIRTSFERPAP